MWWQEGWVWVVAGFALAVLEVLAPAYVFLGFAVGAIIVGVLLWVGLLGGSFPVLILVFAVVSLVAWILFRRMFGLKRGHVEVWDRDKDIND